MSFSGDFSDVDCNQRLNFAGFVTLAVSNVFLFGIPGRCPRPTPGNSKEKGIGLGQRPDSGSLETLDVTNASFLKICRR
jgi:hypothetical protein